MLSFLLGHKLTYRVTLPVEVNGQFGEGTIIRGLLRLLKKIRV